MRLFETANYSIIDKRKIGYIVSGILVILSLGAIITQGLQLGIDFRGGQEIVVEFQDPVTVTDTRSAISNVMGTEPQIRHYGSTSEILIRVDTDMETSALQNTIRDALANAFADNPATIIKTDIVGPSFADDLRNAAFMAVLFSLIVIFIYILVRFKKWSYSAGAVAALSHDVIITLGVFTILNGILPFNLDIDQALIAAFLTIVGYSLNDTVVVFDRIRENALIFKTEAFDSMVNKSINNTLSRTVVTSLTTLFVVSILFIFGGEVLKGLSFALILGVILGTYSSIFVASALLVDLEQKKEKAVA